MNHWKPIAGLLFGIGLVFLAACQEEEPPPKPRPLSPLAACRSECRSASEQLNQECIDRLRAQEAFDRLSECGTQADEYSNQCRAECDAKHAGS